MNIALNGYVFADSVAETARFEVLREASGTIARNGFVFADLRVEEGAVRGPSPERPTTPLDDVSRRFAFSDSGTAGTLPILIFSRPSSAETAWRMVRSRRRW